MRLAQPEILTDRGTQSRHIRLIIPHSERAFHEACGVMGIGPDGEVHLGLVLRQNMAVFVQDGIGQLAPVPAAKTDVVSSHAVKNTAIVFFIWPSRKPSTSNRSFHDSINRPGGQYFKDLRKGKQRPGGPQRLYRQTFTPVSTPVF